VVEVAADEKTVVGELTTESTLQPDGSIAVEVLPIPSKFSVKVFEFVILTCPQAATLNNSARSIFAAKSINLFI
jgi:hypothetical protein